jgi:hypothetical protein
MPLSVRKTQVAAKIESVEGTKEALADADGFFAFNVQFTPDIEMKDRSIMRETFSPYPPSSGKRYAKLAFDVELIGSGVAGTAPCWGKLMKGCAFGETIVPATSVAYKPASLSIPSMTVAAYMDGKIKRIWGARGTVKLNAKAGEFGVLSFEFTGAEFEDVDGAMLTTITYPSAIPPIFMNAALSCDAFAAIATELSIDMANELGKRVDFSSESGYKSIPITGRKPVGSLDPEEPLVATYDFYGKWKTPGALGQLQISANGGVGNIVTITCPKIRYTKITPGEREGFRTLGIDFIPTLDAGDDEVSIALT